ncbi:hypothetical protein D9Q98_009682 [Chlorella vulgaris]|uniref:Molybdopterin synthase catalytic subunit n=1 Tax=Chlorella vulgaris TaxID=3077 RepID=A0A9D4YSG9_CHLVU|nr:hypothetical protein D9Q98_009682 [Chlorella vulgaris]
MEQPGVALQEGACYAEVTPDALDQSKYVELVADPGAGAIASFVGVTRNSFQGKATERLEYEAYIPMAAKKLMEVCRQACSKWQVRRMAVAHRTGTVLVGEASVVIAVSSAHRRDALEACHWAIDELKATVPIWKKEIFQGGEVWKENEEWRQQQAAARLAERGTAAAEGEVAAQHFAGSAQPGAG